MALNGFEVFNLTSGVAFVSITNTSTSFNKNVVLKLNSPRYIKIMLNKEEKKLAIQACEKTEDGAVSFLKEGKAPQNGVRFNNRDFQNYLAHLMEWNISAYIYRVDGIYLDDENAMVFDLTSAKQQVKKNLAKK